MSDTPTSGERLAWAHELEALRSDLASFRRLLDESRKAEHTLRERCVMLETKQMHMEEMNASLQAKLKESFK